MQHPLIRLLRHSTGSSNQSHEEVALILYRPRITRSQSSSPTPPSPSLMQTSVSSATRSKSQSTNPSFPPRQSPALIRPRPVTTTRLPLKRVSIRKWRSHIRRIVLLIRVLAPSQHPGHMLQKSNRLQYLALTFRTALMPNMITWAILRCRASNNAIVYIRIMTLIDF
jgi:hypothetical protein